MKCRTRYVIWSCVFVVKVSIVPFRFYIFNKQKYW